jgi:predicted lactoylglutathione lyase
MSQMTPMTLIYGIDMTRSVAFYQAVGMALNAQVPLETLVVYA